METERPAEPNGPGWFGRGEVPAPDAGGEPGWPGSEAFMEGNAESGRKRTRKKRGQPAVAESCRAAFQAFIEASRNSITRPRYSSGTAS
jgi:hypothetical protein